jgi:hypothetical protein
MAISFSIYSNVYNTTKTVSLDFYSETAAFETDATADSNRRFFFKFTTGSRDTNNLSYVPRVVGNLTDLALNGAKQSASNTASAYTNVNAMITDYLYDYINGHTDDQFLSGCTLKAPMKFSS